MTKDIQDVVCIENIKEEDFKKLTIEKKAEVIEHLILNSMYKCVSDSRVKLPDLTKAQTTMNKKRVARKNTEKINERRFTSTPLPKEPQDQ
jgi:hypothetical protein